MQKKLKTFHLKGKARITAGLLLVLINTANPVFADPSDCKHIALQADKDAPYMYPPLAYVVEGEGRLYFYTAPSEKCQNKDVFVIPGDSLVNYSEYKKWLSVTYFRKDGKSYAGWILPERLKYTGTMGRTND